MKTTYTLILFVAVALVQLFIPAKMIFNQEEIIEEGKLYKFKTQPVDPNDPYRGKYIRLNYNLRTFKTNDSIWKRKSPIYVYLKTDSLGYAAIEEVSPVLKEKENDYVKARVQWYENYSNELHIDFPFNRYYMKETKAYDAEVAVRNRQRDSLPDNTHALVYVKNGKAVLTDVIIDEISIKDYVEKNKVE